MIIILLMWLISFLSLLVTTVQTGADNIPTSSFRTGAIVGGIFGVLLSLVLVVAIVVVVVLYLVRRRQAGGKYSTGRETNGDTGLGKHSTL